MRFIALAIGLWWGVIPLDAAEPPVLLSGNLAHVQSDRGTIRWQWVDDERVQRTHGGSGGSVFRITIDHGHPNEPLSGTSISFDVVAIFAVWVGDESGMPVFEVWGRGGGPYFGCGVMKFKDGRYQMVAGRQYTTIRPTVDARPAAFLPGDDACKQPLYEVNPGTDRKDINPR